MELLLFSINSYSYRTNSPNFKARNVHATYFKLSFRWGDVTLHTSSDGDTYLELNERQTKTRTGENICDVREVSPKIYECPGERDPIKLYEKYVSKRPSGMSNPEDPFYIATRTIPLTNNECDPWFIRQRVGTKKLGAIMKTMKEKGNLDQNKRLTNHSARKYLVQKLKDSNVQDTDIMQISGHKNVQSVKNYSSISEGKHKQISNVLSNTSVDSRAPVPVTSSSNLPLRSLPATTDSDIDLALSDRPTICSQTNMSNRISSMFYGANLHVANLNVYMCDRH